MGEQGSRLAVTAAIVAGVSLVLAAIVVLGGLSIVKPSVSRSNVYGGADESRAATERVLLANAEAEGEPPIGVNPTGPRIHRPGTLARLQYQGFDADGNPAGRWEVRALVPPPVEISRRDDDAFAGNSCPAECQAAVSRGATVLHRTGDPGIAAEWVLRMPLNQALDLGRRSITTQDVLDDRPRPMNSGRYAVTLLEVCAARVQLASVNHLEFFPDAIVPIPRGFRTSRWVQMENCGPLAPYPPPPEPPPPAPRPALPPPPDIRAVALRRATGKGFVTLDVEESWFSLHPAPIEFVLRDVCRYDQAADRWSSVSMPQQGVGILILPRKEPGSSPRVVVRIPEETALFFVRWVEHKDEERSSRNWSHRDTLATSGPMLCEDLSLGPAPTGRVPACIPFENRAEARFVADPREHCGR